MSSEVRVSIQGCRGSFPVSGQDYVRYGGSTSCIVVSVDDLEIILDAGTGIVNYGRGLLRKAIREGRSLRSTIFFSHLHFDHLAGLPFFAPLFHPASTVHFFGPRSSRFGYLENSLNHLFQSPYFPVSLYEMQSVKTFEELGESEVVYFLRSDPRPKKFRPAHPDFANQIPPEEDILAEVHCMRGYNHPKSGVSIYKVIAAGKTFVYATDTEGYVYGDQRLARFSQNADLLVHDAMYTDEHYASLPVPSQGYGHSTVQIAVDLAKLAGVKRLCLFHHDPNSTDDHLDKVAREAELLFPDVTVAQDGLTFSL